MYKSLALAVLLVPLYGHAITREERMQEIEKIIQQMTEKQMVLLRDYFEDPVWIFTLSADEREAFQKQCAAYKEKYESLEKEYRELQEQE